MNEQTRQRVAQAQADLMRALVANGPIPAGFDDSRVRIAARSLVNKRRNALARIWPRLPTILGDKYIELFNAYAMANPMPECAIPKADGRAFLRWLESQKPLSDAARIEAFAFDARFSVTSRGIGRRRGFLLSWMRRNEAPGSVIVLRIPWLGEWWWGAG
ncbi:MAG: hypothetical protein FJ303_06575 [Planctomycetes bacterium]|nr:hypothetical protein [Planctomycetota bacterium]